LRSKVTIADADADWCVALLFGDGASAAVGLNGQMGDDAGSTVPFGGGVATIDPRLPELGVRLLLPRAAVFECLDLRAVPEGRYFLSAFPLPLAGASESPVCPVLFTAAELDAIRAQLLS
ncbi:hypothetical protein, partial [Enterococcus casseliflavus]|uniref:hypothetical protein n=1 Tax=Enterococcus casseliflavus TaxID=37734 RepID=UPI003D0E4944